MSDFIRQFPEQRLTLAARVGAVLKVAVAAAGPRDNFSRKRGRTIAVSRLECPRENISNVFELSPLEIYLTERGEPDWEKVVKYLWDNARYPKIGGEVLDKIDVAQSIEAERTVRAEAAKTEWK